MTTVTTRALLAWYEANARRLPWRSEPRDPYEVIVSEFMLQQTQVERVVGYFGAFVSRFPDLGALAAASEEEVTVGSEVGQLYPNYAFPTLESTDVTALSSFRGTKVLLVQFASW